MAGNDPKRPSEEGEPMGLNRFGEIELLPPGTPITPQALDVFDGGDEPETEFIDDDDYSDLLEDE